MNKEIEIRFLNIDKDNLVKKLEALGAEDLGESMIEEIMFYDNDKKICDGSAWVRLRNLRGKTTLTFKKYSGATIDGHQELEVGVEDFEKTRKIVESMGFYAARIQEKKRHTFTLGDVSFDIDEWPNLRPYLEIEAPSENELKEAVTLVGLDWDKGTFKSVAKILTEDYNLPILDLKMVTFAKTE